MYANLMPLFMEQIIKSGATYWIALAQLGLTSPTEHFLNSYFFESILLLAGMREDFYALRLKNKL